MSLTCIKGRGNKNFHKSLLVLRQHLNGKAETFWEQQKEWWTVNSLHVLLTLG